MDGFARKVAFVEDFSKFDGVGDRLDEDDDLVEFKTVNEIHEFLDLFVGLQLNVVLFEAMESQTRLVFNEHLGGVAHEFATNFLNFRRKCGCKHHNLLVVGRRSENLLDVATHICSGSVKGAVLTSAVEQTVAFVQHKHLEVLHRDHLLVSELKNTAWSSNDDVWGVQAL